jgi:hypothetical protein
MPTLTDTRVPTGPPPVWLELACENSESCPRASGDRRFNKLDTADFIDVEVAIGAAGKGGSARG